MWGITPTNDSISKIATDTAEVTNAIGLETEPHTSEEFCGVVITRSRTRDMADERNVIEKNNMDEEMFRLEQRRRIL